MLLAITVLALPAQATPAGQGTQGAGPLERPFPYEATEVEIEAMLKDVTAKTGVPVILPERIRGGITLSNPQGSLRDALDAMARQGGAVWWFDGMAVHVEPAAAMVSRLIALDGFTIDELRGQMAATGLDDRQYPLRAAEGAEMVRVVGPRGYADAVAELAAHMAQRRKPEAKAAPRALPTVIRGRGWR